jgi:hypothetical protein
MSLIPVVNLLPESTTVPAVACLPAVADFHAVLRVMLFWRYCCLLGSCCCCHPFFPGVSAIFGVPFVVDIQDMAGVPFYFSTQCCCQRSDVAEVLLLLTSVLILVSSDPGVSM